MGALDGHKTCHTVIDLTMLEVANICEKLAKNNTIFCSTLWAHSCFIKTFPIYWLVIYHAQYNTDSASYKNQQISIFVNLEPKPLWSLSIYLRLWTLLVPKQTKQWRLKSPHELSKELLLASWQPVQKVHFEKQCNNGVSWSWIYVPKVVQFCATYVLWDLNLDKHPKSPNNLFGMMTDDQLIVPNLCAIQFVFLVSSPHHMKAHTV